MMEPLVSSIFEISGEGRCGVSLGKSEFDDYTSTIPANLKRVNRLKLPELTEPSVVRHFTALSKLNFGVDSGFYPLGSCTMKYNPKVNEFISRMQGLTSSHPLLPEELVQGELELIYTLSSYLSEITGMDEFTLQPAAGAHGELTGMFLAKKYFEKKGENRNKIIVPDTAHGTNPASGAISDFLILKLKSGERGVIEPDDLKELMDESVAALMLTNPNTLGLFEENIMELAEIVHDKGGLIYCDGANFNALIGKANMKKMGIDILHLNLHKTFSTPHGGGGPGAGPLGVVDKLASHLPKPKICYDDKEQKFYLDYNLPDSIGKVSAFYGNFGVLIKALAYILSVGSENLSKISGGAVLNANYVLAKLKEFYHLPYDRTCMHECVFSDKNFKKFGVTTLDVAKRLIDYGFHPPTIYFPLIVQGALMIEPTESETRETLDQFIDAMKKIMDEALKESDLLKNAPCNAPLARLNETMAARNPVLSWRDFIRNRV